MGKIKRSRANISANIKDDFRIDFLRHPVFPSRAQQHVIDDTCIPAARTIKDLAPFPDNALHSLVCLRGAEVLHKGHGSRAKQGFELTFGEHNNFRGEMPGIIKP